MPSPPPPPPPPVEPTSVYQEAADDVFEPVITSDDVVEAGAKEAIGEQQPGGGSTHGRDRQESTRVFVISSNQKRSFLRYILGLSYTGIGVDEEQYVLHREPPGRDSEYPQLRAFQVAFSDVAPKADQDHPLSGDPETFPAAENWKCARKASPFKGANDEQMWFAGYEKTYAVVSYRSFGRTRFFGDLEGQTWRNEWRRYTDWRSESLMETLSVSGAGSALKFAETPDGVTPGSTTNPVDPNTKPVIADTYELMPMKVITCRWLDVPHEYLSDDDFILNATKIDACIGTVNDRDMFNGKYKKGTLLLRPPKYDPTLFAVTPADAADTGADNTLLGGWDVTLTWLHFDPPKGTAASEYHGHNLFPWRGRGAEGGAELGKWLFCTRNGSPTGPPLIRYADHRRIFQHVSDPETS